jgi:hypothetical protein
MADNTWQPLAIVTQKIVQELEIKRREDDSYMERLLKLCDQERRRG